MTDGDEWEDLREANRRWHDGDYPAIHRAARDGVHAFTADTASWFCWVGVHDPCGGRVMYYRDVGGSFLIDCTCPCHRGHA